MSKETVGFHWGTGRRKAAVARVRIRPGTGRVQINGRPFENYFVLATDRERIVEPLRATRTLSSVDVYANCHGGGPSGQAGAMVMGIGRALVAANAEFAGVLRDNKFLTRDSRMVERKKYGRKKARKSFQFSKR